MKTIQSLVLYGDLSKVSSPEKKDSILYVIPYNTALLILINFIIIEHFLSGSNHYMINVT